MSKDISCIMLIDDNKDDNFFHHRVIKRNSIGITVIIKESGQEALDYLRARNDHEAQHPDLILLDINMPGMNGWEFLEEYKKLDRELQSAMIIVMLTTSENPDDRAKAQAHGMLADFKTKPLTKEMLDEILINFKPRAT